MSFRTFDRGNSSTAVANLGRPAADAARRQANPHKTVAGHDVAPRDNRIAVQNPHPETIAAQAGGIADAATGGLVPPIHVASAYQPADKAANVAALERLFIEWSQAGGRVPSWEFLAAHGCLAVDALTNEQLREVGTTREALRRLAIGYP